MSIASEIARISQNVSDSLDAVAAKGVTVPSGSTSDDLAGLIALISTGSGTGMTVVETEDSHGGTIVTITGEEVVLQAKTGITPSTSSQTIEPDEGYTGLSSVTVSAIPSQYIVPTGTKSITANGTGIDVTAYAAVDVSVASSAAVLQSKTGITPTESSQTIEADTGYDGLSSVQINAISSTYVGSGISQRSADDITFSGGMATVKAGYYSAQTSKSYPAGTVTAPATISGSSASVSAGTNTLTFTKTVSVTPNVTTAGYISSGTAGNSEVSLTASVNTRNSSDLEVSGDTVTVPAGYYATQASKAVSAMTLPTSASSSATSGYTSKATIGRSTSDQYINIPTGYNSAGAYYKISAVANGSVTAPSTISGSSATVSTGTNTLTLTKTVSVTPNVTTAGYISSGTAGNSSVSLTASVTTKAATTYHPSTSDQTIASGTYTTGTQTIKAVTVSGLSASSILSGTTVKIGDSTDDDCVTSVSGNVTFQTIYTGTSAPSSSQGVNGDIYVQTAS